MPGDFDIRITVLKTNPKLIDDLVQMHKSGQSAREWLIERIGPILKEELEELTAAVKEVVLTAYRQPGYVPGTSMATEFLGEYGRSVLRRYIAMGTHAWPWAYVGLYPQPGPDTYRTRNPMIYVPAIELGARPRGWTTFPRRTKAERKPWIGPGRRMFERVGRWVELKARIPGGTRMHHNYTWLLFKKLLERGTVARELFKRVEEYPDFRSWHDQVLRNISYKVEKIIAGEMISTRGSAFTAR